MDIGYENRILKFNPVEIRFIAFNLTNVFAHKNNLTLHASLQNKRYCKLKAKVEREYSEYLNWKLGVFILELKNKDDSFYREFLNKYGDLAYCKFNIMDYLNQRGLYVFMMNNQIYYVGRCRDSFYKRINNNYGSIQPKNCYLDGQSTNCRLNNLIAQNFENVELYICSLSDEDDIILSEKKLISQYSPIWNTQLG